MFDLNKHFTDSINKLQHKLSYTIESIVLIKQCQT